MLKFLLGVDEDCPNMQGSAFGHQDCTSESGTHFYGLAFYGEGDEVNGEDGFHFEMRASFELEAQRKPLVFRRNSGKNAFRSAAGLGRRSKK